MLGLLTTLVWSASIVDNGSKITKLQSLALSVFNVCVQPSILTITCTMHDDVFRMLDLIAKVSRFISRFYQPGTEALDAFTQNPDGVK